MSRITEYLESHKEEMFSFLAELVAVRSVQNEPNGQFPFGKKPAKALEKMLEKCSEFGFSTENIDWFAGSADFGEGEPVLGILSHLDVVPEGNGWENDPFVLKRENGRLIGRGTSDDKGPAVASLFALRAVKELGIPLKKSVRLIFGTNEENGSADLAYYRTKRNLPPMVFTPDGEYPVINGEKGMLRVYFSAEYSGWSINGGEVINAVPQHCSIADGDRCCELYSGKSAHASTPEMGENAITDCLAHSGTHNKLLNGLARLFPHGECNGKSIFGDIPDITCVLSLINTECGRLKGGIDIRFPMDRTKSEIGGIICGKLTEIGFEIDSCDGSEPHYTDENSSFVQALLRVYEKVTGDKGYCITIGGGTYVHDVVGGVAFGPAFPGENCNIHGCGEFITEESLLKNAEIMAEAIIEICG
ncbi:MAG: Sapep family Mn(2+)-dependent dipeptidase [Ruminococcus flavefaciens]|nr:Sapep family Mn(2+)-dependent dipeptidase [Ruminococcus flavefaciens]MCM1228616.1 Sapep family Mn(2+)-dependent dipeptidase [Ruminococcus flavefaciens]